MHKFAAIATAFGDNRHSSDRNVGEIAKFFCRFLVLGGAFLERVRIARIGHTKAGKFILEWKERDETSCVEIEDETRE